MRGKYVGLSYKTIHQQGCRRRIYIFTMKGLSEKRLELRRGRSGYDFYKWIEASYYSHWDDEDGVLEKVERRSDEWIRAESVECHNNQSSLKYLFLKFISTNCSQKTAEKTDVWTHILQLHILFLPVLYVVSAI